MTACHPEGEERATTRSSKLAVPPAGYPMPDIPQHDPHAEAQLSRRVVLTRIGIAMGVALAGTVVLGVADADRGEDGSRPLFSTVDGVGAPTPSSCPASAPPPASGGTRSPRVMVLCSPAVIC